MSLFILALPILISAPCVPAPQEPDWVEIRFHRVHLRNGNFIDGQLLKDVPKEVVIKIKSGEMGIRRDLIDRVEIIKIRSINEKPVVKQTPKRIEGIPQIPDVPPPALTTPAEIRARVDAILMKYRLLKGEEKGPLPVDDFAKMGEEAAAYMAARLPEMDGSLQQPVAILLSTLKSPKAISVLEGHTSHQNPVIRILAATALGLMGEAEKMKYLRPLLKDPDAGVRKTVVGLLSSVEPFDWFEPMGELCLDPDKEVRAHALSIAGRLATKHDKKEEFTRLLVGSLSRADAGAKADIAATIGGMGVPGNWAFLAPLLRDGEAIVRASAAMALSNLGAAESGPDLVAQLPVERDHWTRVHLAGAVQRLRLPKAIEPLIDWLGDPADEIRKVAGVTLQSITGQSFGADREKWTAWFESTKSK